MTNITNESYMRILSQGVGVWNKWRLKHANVKPNLKGALLRGANLSGAYLAEVNLSEAHLEGANLSNANLFKANLTRAHLCGLHTEGENIFEVTLNKSNLVTITFGGTGIAWANLKKANLSEADLTGVDLSGADIREAQLYRTCLDDANFTWANLDGAILNNATLRKADLFEAYLSKAHLEEANLEGANLERAKLEGTYLCGANLAGANLCRASLVEAEVSNAILNGCLVHGISAWNLIGKPKEQQNLIITRSFDPYNESIITVDDLEISQFIYLILNNQKIRDVIDTITSRAVLILGRFTPQERKDALEAVRDVLRNRGFVPILFDFTPSEHRDLNETVQFLAVLAKFIVADLTDAKSLPQELSHIVPFMPNVPIQPILLASQREYAMFEHWRREYKWVLHVSLYEDKNDLVDHFDEKIIAPIEKLSKKISPKAEELEEIKQKVEQKTAEFEEINQKMVELKRQHANKSSS